MFFPIMIDVEKFNILVVGGGKIAYRKINQLLKYHAKITVIALEVCQDIKNIKENLYIRPKEFEIEDIKGYNIVFAATDNIELNAKISKYCISEKILVNSVDNHKNSSFINMGFFETEIEDSKTIVAVSSMGKNPKKTKKLKNMMKEYLNK